MSFKDKIIETSTHSSERTPLLDYLRKITNEIENDFEGAIDPHFSEDYAFLQNELVEGTSHQYLSDSLSDTDSPENQYINHQIFVLRHENIRKSLSGVLSKNSSVLEVGCGVLDEQGESFISSALPKELANTFNYCDISPKVVKQCLTNNPQSNIKQCDLLKLSNEYGKDAFSVIVGLNVFDTLSKKDLKLSLQQCRLVLKENGSLIHLMNLESYIYSTVHNLCDNDSIVLPILDSDSDRQFLRIEKKALTNLNTLSNDESLFLHYLSELPKEQLERFCLGTIFTDDTYTISLLARKLSKLGKTFSPLELFVNNMTDALNETGYKIQRCELLHSEKEIRALINGPYHQKNISLGPNGRELLDAPSLDWSHAHLKVYTHCILGLDLGLGDAIP